MVGGVCTVIGGNISYPLRSNRYALISGRGLGHVPCESLNSLQTISEMHVVYDLEREGHLTGIVHTDR